MRNDYYTNSKDYINRWVVSYADFVTMLLALFIVMYAVTNMHSKKLMEFQNKVQEVFGKQAVENVTKYQANHAKLEKILHDNISQSKSVKFIKSSKGLIIRVNNTILFDEGSAQIKPQAQKTLNEITKVLTKIDNPVIIEGHTDSIPIKNEKFPSNWELSTARATNIISYLIKNGNISPKRLSAVGYGEYMPIAKNTAISGRMLNRRVDIIVLEKQ
jgi:chemotaxis protein MotB